MVLFSGFVVWFVVLITMLRYLCVICWGFVVYVVELLVECRLVSLFGLRWVLRLGYCFVVFGVGIVVIWLRLLRVVLRCGGWRYWRKFGFVVLTVGLCLVFVL